MKVSFYKYFIRQSLLIAFLFLYNCSDREDVVATVNNVIISESELKNAYQFNPHLASVKNDSIARRLTLQSLLLEKVLVSNAPAEISASEKIKNQVVQIEREATIESYWQQVIFPKISISEEEIYNAYMQSKTQNVVKLLVFDDQQQVRASYDKIITNKDTKKSISDILPSAQTLMDTFSTTSAPQTLMTRISKLNIGEISEPFQWGSLYYIVQNINEIRDIGSSETEFAEQREKIRKVLYEREAKEIFDRQINNGPDRVIYEIDKNVLKEFVNDILSEFESEKIVSEQQKQTFAENIQDVTGRKIKNIVRFSDGTILSTKQIAERIRFSPYPLSYKNSAKLRQSILFAIKNILDDEIILKKAANSNLTQSYIGEEKRIWKDYYIYKQHLRSILRQDKNAEKVILSMVENADIIIEPDAINFNIPRTDMAVLKKQFPGRNLYPIVQPMNIEQLNSYFDKIMGVKK